MALGGAATDTHSHGDPVEEVYDARVRGVCLVSTADGRRMHLHGGCWVTACSHHPARLLVAFPKEFEGAAIVRHGGVFAVSLVADDQSSLNDALFAGRHSLDAIGRQYFLRAPSGCPVLCEGVGYFDCALAETVDLGDFLLAVGDLRAGAVLHPAKRNLTVNEIQRRGVPVATAAELPFRGFDDSGDGLKPAPDQGASGALLDEVCSHRQWGLFLVGTHGGGEDHLHLGSWAIQCSHRPPRMLVCVDRSLPAYDLVRTGGGFALSLLAADQLPLAVAVAQGAGTPGAFRGARFERTGDGFPVVVDAVAHFACRVEGEFNAGADHAGFYGPVTAFSWGRRSVPQLRADQVAAELDG